jgi:hypothetical protein
MIYISQHIRVENAKSTLWLYLFMVRFKREWTHLHCPPFSTITTTASLSTSDCGSTQGRHHQCRRVHNSCNTTTGVGGATSSPPSLVVAKQQWHHHHQRRRQSIITPASHGPPTPSTALRSLSQPSSPSHSPPPAPSVHFLWPSTCSLSLLPGPSHSRPTLSTPFRLLAHSHSLPAPSTPLRSPLPPRVPQGVDSDEDGRVTTRVDCHQLPAPISTSRMHTDGVN